MTARGDEAATVVVEGTPIEISHPAKVLWPGEGITKRDLVDYYLGVEPLVLPFLRDRPLTLKPYPRGIGGPSFFLRTRPDGAPEWLPAVAYHLQTEDEVTCPIVVGDARTLVWCANRNAIELHPWLSRVPHLDRPDLMMFDLNPGPELGFRDVLRVALALRAALASHGLTGFAKTSGKRGVHVLVPLDAGPSFERVREVCEGIGGELRAALPDLATLDYRVDRRPGLVLVDYSQNSIAKSTVAPYSLRPVPGAHVSTPLTWAEVEAGEIDPAAFTLCTLTTRLQQVGNLIDGFDAARAALP